jgi:hypothetical protein
MKKILLISLFFGIFIQIVNAQKCKPRWDETDDFTETTTEYWGNFLTSMTVFNANNGYRPQLYVFKEKGKYKVMFAIVFEGKLKDDSLNGQKWFEKGTKFLFKLSNEIVSFEVEKSVIKNTRGTTNIRLISTITEDDVEKFINQTIERYRVFPFIDNEDKVFEYKVAKSYDKKIKKQLSCILK